MSPSPLLPRARQGFNDVRRENDENREPFHFILEKMRSILKEVGASCDPSDTGARGAQPLVAGVPRKVHSGPDLLAVPEFIVLHPRPDLAPIPVWGAEGTAS